ncbi:MAG: CHAT domain-containing protein [Oculatellaceae cyanobacterium Prado106]|jgi:CHAT domain-containing protein|nr:CHAT domain-containing protein [Oculatellaceae cyanobacterium Prado106]
MSSWYFWLRSLVLSLVACGVVVLWDFVGHASPIVFGGVESGTGKVEMIALSPASALLSQGQEAYERGRLMEAVAIWRRVVERGVADDYEQALAWNYLAIAYQDLGQWDGAMGAIAQAQGRSATLQDSLLAAQIFNTQGSLYLNQGEPEVALTTWEQAESLYAAAADEAGVILSQMNQTQALRALGRYRQARDRLEALEERLRSQPDSLLKARHLRSLGMTLRGVGDLGRSQATLWVSLAIVESLDSSEYATGMDRAETLLQLGNTASADGDFETANRFYQQAQDGEKGGAKNGAGSSRVAIEARLNQLSLSVKTQEWQRAQALFPDLIDELKQQAASRWLVYAKVNLAESVMRLPQIVAQRKSVASPSVLTLAQLLAGAVQQAHQLQDVRAESYALGSLGHLYEQTQQWTEALDLTQQAAALAAGIQTEDVMIHWVWQEGRLLKALGQKDGAIAAYEQAVGILKSLRQDLLAMNPEVQFSFRDQVEPVYRELVDLLLGEVHRQPEALQQSRLKQARKTIEALQLAQLQNFFREACQTYEPRTIDQVDSRAAVIYSIVLPESLEVILSLPNRPLFHYRQPIMQTEVTEMVTALRQSLNPAFLPQEGLPMAQKFYDWLIRPALLRFQKQPIDTLVFVLDDFLRDVPMAVLHDGQHYLIEEYAIALTPGLELFDIPDRPSPNPKVLVGGISEAHQGFAALPGVAQEVANLQTQLRSEVLLNQGFTTPNLYNQVEERHFPIIHLATHAQFSSRAADTFILTWNDRLLVKDLSQWLASRNEAWSDRPRPIDLLVLSACQTAKGDKRALLGLAGIATRSGARSTLATLWAIQDRSTADFMAQFYQKLIPEGRSKAAALQSAQLTLLRQPKYQHPYYWAAYVLVGNWQ